MPEMRGRIIVYSLIGCPSCIRAKGLLKDRGLPYVNINLESSSRARQDMMERTGEKTVPQIFFNAFHIGGLIDYENLVSRETIILSLMTSFVVLLPHNLFQDNLKMIAERLTHFHINSGNTKIDFVSRNVTLTLI